MLSVHNSPSIGAMALFTMLAVFATIKIRTYQEQKPTAGQRKRNATRLSQGRPTSRFLPYSPSLPLLWKSTSRDEF
jgi:hypothetical protein